MVEKIEVGDTVRVELASHYLRRDYCYGSKAGLLAVSEVECVDYMGDSARLKIDHYAKPELGCGPWLPLGALKIVKKVPYDQS